MPEKQSIGLHRHKKQVSHVVEIFDAVTVAGLNCKPRGSIHRPSSFPFVYLPSHHQSCLAAAFRVCIPKDAVAPR